MKVLIVLVLAVAVATIHAENHDITERAVGCETILPANLCTTLKIIAKNLKLPESFISKALQIALGKGLSKVDDIFKDAVTQLKNKVTDKKCEDFLAVPVCTRIRKVAERFSLSGFVEDYVIDAIVNGLPSEHEILMKVFHFIRQEIIGKKCDELLAKDVCSKLEAIGQRLNIDPEKISNYVKEAIIAGYDQADAIFAAVIKFFREDIKALTCKDILNDKACSVLESFGKIFKVTPEQIAEEVKEAVLRGKVFFQDIVADVKDFVNRVAKTKKCEDLLPDKFCNAVKSLASKLKVKMELVDQAVNEALRKGITGMDEILKFCKDFFKERITCESWLGDKTCRYIKSFAETFGIKVREVEAKLRELIAEGKTAVTDIYKQIISFIRSKIFG